LCFGADIDSAGGAATTSLANDTVAELADETILMSKFCTSGRVRGKEDDVGRWKWSRNKMGYRAWTGWGSKREGLGRLQVGWALGGKCGDRMKVLTWKSWRWCGRGRRKAGEG